MPALSTDTTIGIVGAGSMGAGIAQVAAAAGHPVLLLDAQRGVAEAAKGKIADALARVVEKGRMSSEEMDGLLGRITPIGDIWLLSEAGLVVEAIIEDLRIKAEVLAQVEAELPPGALLATNTSSLSITELGAALQDPSRFAGLHFFNPAPLMPLVEVVKGLTTSDDTVATLVDTARAWGKTAVVAKNAPGFIVNKGARPFYGEALRFLEEGGADAATIDSLSRAAGFKMGPFELIDLIGLDINLAVSKSMWQAYYGEPRYQPSMLVAEMVAAGYLGRKSGRGFYDYGETAKPEPKIMPPGPRPKAITVCAPLISAKALVEMCRGQGIEVRGPEKDGMEWIEIGDVRLSLTNGNPGTPEFHNEVLYDLSLDYTKCDHIAITTQNAGPEAMAVAAGFFQALGMRVSHVKNLPGLIVARTISMLCNEAADTLSRGIASAHDIDLAMEKGLGWPGGPLHWCDSLGSDSVAWILDNLSTRGGERYRAVRLLMQMAGERRRFHA